MAKDIYFTNPEYNVLFSRCIDELAKLIEKYSGDFMFHDIGYEYCIGDSGIPIRISNADYEECQNRLIGYIQFFYLYNTIIEQECQKAS